MLVNEMILFYHIVRLKSFSQTAEKLSLSKAFVSKHITLLEKQLKTRLLLRNTRQLRLTEAGELFYIQCEKIFKLVEESYEGIAHLRHQPSGTLKISAPSSLGNYLLSKPLNEYLLRYPEVKLNVILDNNIVDMVHDGYDLALRSGILPDSSLVARPLLSLDIVLCAAPSYLKNYGPIEHPEQLMNHRFAVLGTNTKGVQNLEFIQGKRRFKIMIEGQFQSNHIDLILKMVMGGHYIAIFPEFISAPLFSKKQLIPYLPAYHLPPKPLYIIYPQQQYIPLKVKAFIEVLENSVKELFPNNRR